MSLLRMLHKILRTGVVTEVTKAAEITKVTADPVGNTAPGMCPTDTAPLDYRQEELRRRIHEVLGGSLHIRHLDTGSCNGCDWELTALLNPIYDIQRFGIDFVASPRHADMLIATGGITRHMAEAVMKTWEATPNPKMVLALGDCAVDGGLFGRSYAHYGGIRELLPVAVAVPGCPPKPQAIIDGILLALDRCEIQKKPPSRNG